MKVYLNSLSADTESVDSLLTVLVVMVLAVNGNETQEFSPSLRGHVQRAGDLLKQHGLYKDMTRYLNKFLLTKALSVEDAVEVGRTLKAARVSFTRDISIDREHLDFLSACAQNLFNDSDSAWNKISRNVRILNNPQLAAVFTEDSDLEVEGMTYKDAAKKIKPLVKRLTGKATEFFLTPKEAQAARSTNPEVLSEYSKYAKVLTKSAKHEIFQFVRKQHKPLVSIDVVRAHLESIGLPNTLPRGFTGGQMDEAGKAYTAEGRLLDKVPFGPVQMNPKYDPEKDNTYVLTDAVGTPSTRARTVTFIGGNKSARHSLVQEFIKSEEENRSKWVVDLSKKGSEEQVLATMVEILYATAARIGGKGNATAGEPTYGLSTLQVGHLKLLPTKVIFDYAGKKSASQYAEYKLTTPVAKKVAEVLKTQIQGKAPTDLVFVFKRHHLNRQRVSAYLKGHGIALTPHKFRQITGTKLTQQILAKAPFKKTQFPKQAEVERWFKEEGLKVGEALHHRSGEKITSATAIKSYIDPQVVADFFDGLGLRRPKWLPN